MVVGVKKYWDVVASGSGRGLDDHVGAGPGGQGHQEGRQRAGKTRAHAGLSSSGTRCIVGTSVAETANSIDARYRFGHSRGKPPRRRCGISATYPTRATTAQDATPRPVGRSLTTRGGAGKGGPLRRRRGRPASTAWAGRARRGARALGQPVRIYRASPSCHSRPARLFRTASDSPQGAGVMVTVYSRQFNGMVLGNLREAVVPGLQT